MRDELLVLGPASEFLRNMRPKTPGTKYPMRIKHLALYMYFTHTDWRKWWKEQSK
ncbi:MAG: hypothetical protein Unbinned3891contig1000_33 [Prokaryotic dsDNA virus sp.]|nr:MAG: hypothetical protein Unbinned3891contig1000_33 [Prokaryotic dsDNA virus sp.]|tara:strand:- start:2392 stop:2556 length:165 start_codon:yes stop_codon:yes gene_type:complete